MAQMEIERVRAEMQRVFLGQEEVVETVLAAFFAGGHVLLEGVPGVGKTLVALAMARLFDLQFRRIQFTNDMLPADVTGFHSFGRTPGEPELVRGAVFGNIVLADEINRTSPKTQSALLEAMEERQVTIDGITYELPRPFMVIATQNPVEVAGTFELPESQLDRFLVKVGVGYPSLEAEQQILLKGIDHGDALHLRPVLDADEVHALISATAEVAVHEDVLNMMTAVVRATRVHPQIELGVSPRGGLALKRMSQARALIHGRDYVTPGDVRSVAVPVLAHRIIARAVAPERAVEAVLDEVALPL